MKLFIHVDVPSAADAAVDAIEPAVARADAAGARRESEITEHAYGRMAYDAITTG